MAKELDIGAVARLSGVAPSALRHYEKKGLIASTGRHGLRRQYAA
ncbi:MerR family DNA-binding transcriptional regulator, partial [Serratia marcescens]